MATPRLSLLRRSSPRLAYWHDREWRDSQPFTRPQAIKEWHAQFPDWPPKDASPPMAIEPWGKQFFAYCGAPETDLRGDPRQTTDDSVRPEWLKRDMRHDMLLGELSNPAGRRRVKQAKRQRQQESAEKAATLFELSEYRNVSEGSRLLAPASEAELEDERAELEGARGDIQNADRDAVLQYFRSSEEVLTYDEANAPENQTEPFLALTDFRKRVLCQFTLEEWEALSSHLSRLEYHLRREAKDVAGGATRDLTDHIRKLTKADKADLNTMGGGSVSRFAKHRAIAGNRRFRIYTHKSIFQHWPEPAAHRHATILKRQRL